MTRKSKLPKALKAYKDSDYLAQHRARFIFNLCIAVLVTLAFLISYRLITHPLGSDNINSHFSALFPAIILFFLVSGCLLMLLKGYYNISANLIPLVFMVVIWFIIIFEKATLLIKLDTIVYIFTALAMVPLLIEKRKFRILLYPAFNILILFLVIGVFKSDLGLSKPEVSDYLIDVSISIAFVGFVGYNVYTINKNALERAEEDLKERKEAELSLDKSERKYKEMMDLLPQIVTEIDLNANITYLNLAGFEKFGFSEEDFKQGISIFSVLLEKEFLSTNIEKVLKGGNSDNQYTVLKKNGEKFPVQMYSAAIIENGVPIGLRAVIIDISDKIKALENLRKSEKKFREMTLLLPQMVFESDLKGMLTYVNKAGIAMFGYSEGDIHQGINILENMIEEDRERAEENIKKVLEGEMSQGNQYTGRRKDGSTFPIRIYSAAIKDGDSLLGLRGIIYDITDTVKVQEEIRQNNELFRTLVESTPVMITLSDMKGRLRMANNTFCKFVGLPIEMLIGNSPADIGIKDNTEISKEYVDQLYRNGHIKNVETKIYNIKGECIDVVSSVNIVKVNNEKAILQTTLDITDRKKLENKLKESETLFRLMVDMVPYSILIYDNEGKYRFANKSFLEQFHFDLNDIIGKSDDDLGLIMDNETLKLVHKDLKENKKMLNFEVSLLSPEKKKNHVLLSYQPVTIDEEPHQIVTVIDITDQKNLENKLRESETLFRLMVDMVPYSIIINDSNGHYTFANRAFLKRFHFQLNEILGKSFSDLGFEMDKENMQKLIEEFENKGKVLNIEVSLTSPKKEKMFVLLSAQTVEIDESPHRIATTVDITDRKLLEDQLKEYNLNLEYLVKARTEELATTNEVLQTTNEELYTQREQLELTLNKLKEAQEQLIQTEKMASLGILTAGVAHEINNPINFISNGAMAIESYISENMPEHLLKLKPLFEAINTGINRTTGIVKSLNKYSRKEDVSSFRCNIHEIIENCLTMLLNQFKNRIEIIKEYSENMPEIIAKEGQLHQAFTNVLINAIQAIDDKGEISIKTSIDHDKALIRITDTGKGISKEDLKHIFDPFFTTKEPGKGTGLGLSITQRIIQEHSGSIQCKSQLNIGTEFIIVLPINKI